MIKLEKLEANICHHCNNRCCSCNHLSSFAPPYYMAPDTLHRDLEALKALGVRVGFLCLQGGEPLLHERIVPLIKVAWHTRIADQVGVLTNGKLLPQMEDGFWECCRDYNVQVRCTVYPNLPAESLRIATEKAQRFGVDFRPSGVTTQFLKMLMDNDGSVFHSCPWKVCYTVHEGYFYLCPIAPFMLPQIMGYEPHVDGVEIAALKSEDDLQAYLNRTEPLLACRKCAGCKGGGIEWKQSRNLEEWIKDSTA